MDVLLCSVQSSKVIYMRSENTDATKSRYIILYAVDEAIEISRHRAFGILKTSEGRNLMKL